MLPTGLVLHLVTLPSPPHADLLGLIGREQMRESKIYEDMINNGRFSFITAPMGGMLEGGVPIVVDGQYVGAVGVSGVKSAEDVQIAKAGIAALV